MKLQIEQGSVLINNKLGIVTGIAASLRLDIKISGKASHSGTPPMNMRKDAFLGASEIVLEIEKAAKCEEECETVRLFIPSIPTLCCNIHRRYDGGLGTVPFLS
ncbi:hypothetical protein PBAT_20245 [Paenibacillus antarcticus]|uniref:Peptidase M20 dimerisation domain-containing protein n=1 Tax=Paenibacillus antarcticus TaxID=253703 RepID=A0A168KYE1_9BACL|nr:hypothetical protein [Paenibacillus antarcticus]OAB42624.1 hypothetical protein PBAT_20245 [Paenibacillus antarcticus]